MEQILTVKIPTIYEYFSTTTLVRKDETPDQGLQTTMHAPNVPGLYSPAS